MIRPRSARANIAWAVGAKAISMLIAVLSVPLLLQLLGTNTYGTWATLISLIAFISLLDLGVGNSMRNSVASMRIGGEEDVRTEFVGFFQLLSCVGLLGAVAFVFVLPMTDVPTDNWPAALLLYLPLLLLLPLMLGSSVLQGARATGVQAVLQAAGGWLFFAFIALLAWRGAPPELMQLAVAWSCFYTVSVVAIFAMALRTISLPTYRLLKWSLPTLPRQRLYVGLEFLMLQLSSLVLYGLGNALIFQNFGASEVARYDVLNKIFQVGLSLFSIAIGVMWSEIATHRAAGDGGALSRTLCRLAGAAVIFSLLCITGAFAIPWVIERWTQHRIQVTTLEAVTMAALASVQSLAYVGAVFMNAFERIRVQVVLAVVSIVLMIPLSRWLMSEGMGIASVPFSAAALTLLPMIVCNAHAIRLVRSVGPLQVSRHS